MTEIPDEYKKKYPGKSTVYAPGYTEANAQWTKDQYERMGIKVLDDFDGYFVNVELPEGWCVRYTDHSMWLKLLDNQERERVSIFFKSASYDYEAFSNFLTRYNYIICPEDEYKSKLTFRERALKPFHAWLTDCGERIKLIGTFEAQTFQTYLDKKDETLKAIANHYLDGNYPNWRDIHAYWNEEDETHGIQ